MPITYISNLDGDYDAECEHCGWTAQLRLPLGFHYKVGDSVHTDPEQPFFGKCRKCQRYSLKVTSVPSPPAPDPPRGFWSVPTE